MYKIGDTKLNPQANTVYAAVLCAIGEMFPKDTGAPGGKQATMINMVRIRFKEMYLEGDHLNRDGTYTHSIPVKALDSPDEVKHPSNKMPAQQAHTTAEPNSVHPGYYKDKGDGNSDLLHHERAMFPKTWALGNDVLTALKYLVRFPYKGHPVQDLKKARTYIDRAIDIVANGKD